MSEFEEELNNLPVSIITNYTEYWNKAQLLTVFKDWQPPKQQQELPVVPEDVDKAIKYLRAHNTTSFSDFNEILTTKGFNWLNDFQFKDRRFGFGGLNNKLFILAHLAINGYEVEKQKLFYLKNKLTGMYLYKKPIGGYGEEPTDSIKDLTDDFKFTQREIDKMDAQGYDKED